MAISLVIVSGHEGFLVPNVSWQKRRPTSIAASMLEYGVFLGDIIPHKATFVECPKNGTCPCTLNTPDD